MATVYCCLFHLPKRKEGGRCRSRHPNECRAQLEVHSNRATRERSEVGGEIGIRTHGRVSPTHAFQACLIDRSSISPFRVNNLRSPDDQHSGNCDKSSNVPRSLTGFSSIAA